MGFNCGLIGLPNVGKSTIFNALCKSDVSAGNYPFCTIDPNLGKVKVPDNRLDMISGIIRPEKVTHATLEFIDIAGLVEGASQGQGLGNQFLSHIRDVDVIAHVVRLFWDENVAHSSETIDGVRDAEIVLTELIMKDLETIEKAWLKAQGNLRATGKTREEALIDVDLLSRLKEGLQRNTPVRKIPVSGIEKKRIHRFSLLTEKPMFYIANVEENELNNTLEQNLVALSAFAEREGTIAIPLSAKLEVEMIQLNPDEREEFMEELSINQSGLEKVISAGYKLLQLVTFFTIQGTECKAWSIKKGTTASQAAGKIHSDFERGFIKAEVISWQELIKYRSETVCRDKGLVRMEGKDYIINDGDVIRFKFNV